jgi:hypothetical protein
MLRSRRRAREDDESGETVGFVDERGAASLGQRVVPATFVVLVSGRGRVGLGDQSLVFKTRNQAIQRAGVRRIWPSDRSMTACRRR